MTSFPSFALPEGFYRNPLDTSHMLMEILLPALIGSLGAWGAIDFLTHGNMLGAIMFVFPAGAIVNIVCKLIVLFYARKEQQIYDDTVSDLIRFADTVYKVNLTTSQASSLLDRKSTTVTVNGESTEILLRLLSNNAGGTLVYTSSGVQLPYKSALANF